MSKRLGPLDEISVSAKLDEHGLSASTKSRALTAFDRLLGNFFDVLGVKVESSVDRARALADGDVRLIEEQNEMAVKSLRGRSEIGDRAVDNFLRGQTRKQSNRDTIAKIAYEEVLLLPPPNLQAEDVADADIDEDWLNTFESHAENASSDEMQRLWGRVLAGEIRAPGSFSLAALRVLSIVDRKVATKFESVLDRLFHTNGIVLPDEIGGDEYEDILFLCEVGLLHFAIGNSKFYDLTGNGRAIVPVRQTALVLEGIAGLRVEIDAAYLTNVGEEIAGIISLTPDTQITDRLIRVIEKKGLTSISRARFERDGEKIKFWDLEVAWTAENDADD